MYVLDESINRKMDRLSYELLHRIFHYIDQLPDLIRASLVCRHWRSCIMNNEYFLNKWFHRSLKYAQQSPQTNPSTNNNDTQQGLTRNIDQSLFPINLQSSECYLLPIIDPFHIIGFQHFFEQQYPSSLFDGFHSFSFWFFLPRKCELAVRIGYYHVLDLHTCLHADHKSNVINGKQILLDDQWIHIVLANIELQNRYCIWINGQDLKNFDLHRTCNRHTTRSLPSNAIFLSCKLNNYSIQSPIEARIADLIAFKRCLSIMEIRAIYQQQTCIDQVQIGAYVKNKKIH
jgi:hypothetical protein